VLIEGFKIAIKGLHDFIMNNAALRYTARDAAVWSPVGF